MTAGPRCSESCPSVDCCSSACKVDENNRNLTVQTNAKKQSIVASVPTHRSLSDDSWPTVLGIVPVSRLFCNSLQNQETTKSLCSDHRNNTNTSPIVASVPTHRLSSDDSWPTALGIVPVSCLLAKSLQNRRNIRPHTNTPSSLHSSHVAPRTCQTTARARCSRRKARTQCRRTT
jgi:hypothetical protein